MDNPTEQEMREYLLEWFWEKVERDDVEAWKHHKFPGKQFLLPAAYRKMKAIEPSSEPVLTVQKNDPEGAQKLNAFFKERGIDLRFKTVNDGKG